MEAPKCKLCGERHYGLCLVAAEDPLDYVSVPLNARPAFAKVVNRNKGRPLPMEPEDAPKPKFDRNAYHRDYMREYMRKRRAKVKK